MWWIFDLFNHFNLNLILNRCILQEINFHVQLRTKIFFIYKKNPINDLNPYLRLYGNKKLLKQITFSSGFGVVTNSYILPVLSTNGSNGLTHVNLSCITFVSYVTNTHGFITPTSFFPFQSRNRN
jgi:hypothetical protein